MIDTSSLDLMSLLVGVLTFVLALGLLIFAITKGYVTSRLFSTRAIALIVSGIGLASVAGLAQYTLQVLAPERWAAGNAEDLVGFMTYARLQWLASNAGLGLVAFGLFIAVRQQRNANKETIDARRELEVSKYFEYQAEERFRYLFDSTSNSVYCYRFDPPLAVDLPIEDQIERSHYAVLQDCNVVFARELDADDPSEVIGSLFGQLDSAKDTESHNAYFRTFVGNNYHLNGYEFNYKSLEGEDRALRINMVGVVKDGLLHRMWAVENNTLEMQKTKAALSRQRQYQALVAEVSSRLVKSEDSEADASIQECMQRVCGFIDADRSTMFWLNNTANIADVAYAWSVDGGQFGPISMDQFPEFGARLRDFERIRINDVERMSDEFKVDKASLARYGIRSLLILPVVVGGETIGGMTLGRIHEQKDWTDQDVGDMTVFAELFANFVLRLRSRRALDDALAQLQRATDRLEAENVYLREEIQLTHGFDDIIGQSNAVLRSLQLVEQVAPTKTSVLIMGETGTGKELVARAIHALSERFDRPLVKVNCAALPASLIESELFGHEKGAFTGADGAKRGRFDLADGSTLFLDEIGEIPIELQAKLLRVLQEGEFDRLGGSKTVKVDVRIVAATNRDLSRAVEAGEFRSDLFYRINTFPIEIPALRDRGDDIQLLAEHFVNIHASRLGRDIREISADMMNQIRRYRWPGNVRELEGIVQRALICSDGPVLRLAERLLTAREDKEAVAAAQTVSDLKLVERDHIVAVLENADWKISGSTGAASRLGIPPSTLRSKMKKLAIMRPH